MTIITGPCGEDTYVPGDPNELLQRLLDLARSFIDTDDALDMAGYGDLLSSLVLELDDSIRAGNGLPAAWIAHLDIPEAAS